MWHEREQHIKETLLPGYSHCDEPPIIDVFTTMSHHCDHSPSQYTLYQHNMIHSLFLDNRGDTAINYV